MRNSFYFIQAKANLRFEQPETVIIDIGIAFPSQILLLSLREAIEVGKEGKRWLDKSTKTLRIIITEGGGGKHF